MNNYDLSDQVKFVLPEWGDNEVLFPEPLPLTLKLTTYEDSYSLNQFTSEPKRDSSYSNESMSRQIAVRLSVPKDLEIKADSNLYIDYVNE